MKKCSPPAQEVQSNQNKQIKQIEENITEKNK
jgi:hypothetical protein